jgi:hypothetical protein
MTTFPPWRGSMPEALHSDAHLSSQELAALLDRGLSVAGRMRAELHLAACADCRHEAAAVSRILRTAPSPRRVLMPLGLAAALAALLLVPRLQVRREPPDRVSREPSVTTAVTPLAIAPRGAMPAVGRLVWSMVPHADRYRVKVMDENGTSVWQGETADTITVLPDSVRLAAEGLYFWQVEARIGWERWVASDLQDFTVQRGRPLR